MKREDTKKATVCTLFEKSYHLGLAVFVNSLSHCGFEGDVYAGYRGPLPPWSDKLEEKSPDHAIFSVSPDINLHFVRLHTEEHLTNVKPDFMIDLWKNYCPDSDYLCYFDPDIVLKTNWLNILKWTDQGVALCEDMNSPLPLTHPLRLQWKKYYSRFEISVEPKSTIYVNGGFVGIKKSQIQFLYEWLEIQNKMKLQTGVTDTIGIADRWDIFHYTDQDALNVAKDTYDGTSIMEKGAMDFGRVGYVMSHAAGTKKPWTKKYLSHIILESSAPTSTDKLFWSSTKHPIQAFSKAQVFRKKTAIKIASFLGRFVRRS